MLKPLEEINILVMGESGVGKSTWINAIANYASYKSLDEALRSPLITLLPVKFDTQDQNKQKRTICLGLERNDNENFKPGESCTQSPKTYTFKMQDKLIRIIDTPGILDTGGVQNDRKNDRTHGRNFIVPFDI